MSRMPYSHPWHRRADDRWDETSSWAVSFGDMMSLVLCFFVMIVAISPPAVARGERYRTVLASVRSVFGGLAEGNGVRPDPSPVADLVAAAEGGAPAAEGVELRHEADGVHLRLSPGMFTRGPNGWILEEAGAAAVRRLAESAAGLEAEIEIWAYGAAGAPSGKTSGPGLEIAGAIALADAFGCAEAVAGVLAQRGRPADRFHVVPTRVAEPLRDGCRVDVVIRVRGIRSGTSESIEEWRHHG